MDLKDLRGMVVEILVGNHPGEVQWEETRMLSLSQGGTQRRGWMERWRRAAQEEGEPGRCSSQGSGGSLERQGVSTRPLHRHRCKQGWKQKPPGLAARRSLVTSEESLSTGVGPTVGLRTEWELSDGREWVRTILRSLCITFLTLSMEWRGGRVESLFLGWGDLNVF